MFNKYSANEIFKVDEMVLKVFPIAIESQLQA